MKLVYLDSHNFYKVIQQKNYIISVKIIQSYFMIRFKNIIFIDLLLF